MLIFFVQQGKHLLTGCLFLSSHNFVAPCNYAGLSSFFVILATVFYGLIIYVDFSVGENPNIFSVNGIQLLLSELHIVFIHVPGVRWLIDKVLLVIEVVTDSKNNTFCFLNNQPDQCSQSIAAKIFVLNRSEKIMRCWFLNI